jgi:hypothetical protein
MSHTYLTPDVLALIHSGQIDTAEAEIKTKQPKLTPALLQMALGTGMLDANLSDITRWARLRQEAVGAQRAASLSIGDRITISHTVSPKLLAGCPAEVTGFEGSKIKVRLLATRSSKWYQGSTVTLPRTLIGD